MPECINAGFMLAIVMLHSVPRLARRQRMETMPHACAVATMCPPLHSSPVSQPQKGGGKREEAAVTNRQCMLSSTHAWGHFWSIWWVSNSRKNGSGMMEFLQTGIVSLHSTVFLKILRVCMLRFSQLLFSALTHAEIAALFECPGHIGIHKRTAPTATATAIRRATSTITTPKNCFMANW